MKISGTQLLRTTLAYHARNPKVEVIPMELELDSALGMRDVEEIPRLMDLGEQTAQRRIASIRRIIENFHSPTNRMKRLLRSKARRVFHTSEVKLPEYI